MSPMVPSMELWLPLIASRIHLLARCIRPHRAPGNSTSHSPLKTTAATASAWIAAGCMPSWWWEGQSRQMQCAAHVALRFPRLQLVGCSWVGQSSLLPHPQLCPLAQPALVKLFISRVAARQSGIWGTLSAAVGSASSTALGTPEPASGPGMEISPSVKRAALFTADALESVNAAPLLKKYGIKDKRYKARLVNRLRTQYGLQLERGVPHL